MRGFLFRTSSICLSGLLAAAATAACGGDDDDDGGDNPDAGDGTGADAAIQSDAAPAVTRTGTIAITETVITNPVGTISGAVVNMTYIDDQSVLVAPLPEYPDSINGCEITVYNVAEGEQPGESVDEGSFTVTGTAHGEFRCVYTDSADDYVCQSTNEDVRGGVIGNADTATLNVGGEFNLAGARFTPEMQGMSIQLSGFTGGEESADGTYAIIDVLDADTIVLADVPTSAIGGAEATYTTFVGSPIPNPNGFDFLDDGVSEGAQDVVVTKDASELVPGFTVTARARGDGFTLTGDSTLPHEFPAVAEDVVFACADAGCGSEPAQGPGILAAMVVTGTTTDVLPAQNDDGITMLPPTGKFATFTCSMIGADAVTIPSDAVQAILDSDPARIQMTVGRFAASLQTVPDRATSRVVIGHSLTGYTTLAPSLLRPR
jgi:hypothetical protein